VRLARGDWPVRIASVLLAAVLWFVIAGRQTAERGVAVPLELRNVPRDLELTGDPVNSVDVRLRASPGLIDTLDSGKVRATIDLAGAREGETIVQLAPAQVHVPFGFRVVKITPSILTLNLEATQRKRVPVRPRLIGRPAPGFEVASVSSEPAEVQVAGPRSRVQEVESAFTEAVSVDAVRQVVERVVNVGLEDPLLRLDAGSTVRVTAVVTEARGTRVLENMPVVARGGPARIDPSRVAVVVSGPEAALAALDAGELRAFVSVPPDGPLPARLPLLVELPAGRPGLAVVETRPRDVAVQALRRRRAP
jgi:YbbR domain-containing protein